MTVCNSLLVKMHKTIKNRTKQSIFLLTVFLFSLISLAYVAELEMDSSIINGMNNELAPELSTLGQCAYTILEAILFSF